MDQPHQHPSRNGDPYSTVPAGAGPRPISPTDISQFVRLDQCQRYLRLRLHDRFAGDAFLREYGVDPQAIPPLLTRSGAAFEQSVTTAMQARYRVVECGAAAGGQTSDNGRLVALARSLPPGQVVMLVQPRLIVTIGDWRLRGDADIVRLERDADGGLRLLIVDVKSSVAAKIEHRLQVAFYDRMTAALLDAAGVGYADIQTGILYRTGSVPAAESAGDLLQLATERRLAADLLAMPDGLLELVERPEEYRRAVSDLVTRPGSAAERVAEAPFASLPYHLTFKCDGCLYNEFCMKWSAERDDLSLLPYVSAAEKQALQDGGIATIHDLSRLKQPRVDPVTGEPDPLDLVPVPESRDTVNWLGGTWPVGPRLDELIHRARSYRAFKGDPVTSLPFIPSKGYGSLPYVSPDHNPNLIRIYIDAQHDFLHDRLAMAGALVVASEHGRERPHRRRVVIELAAGPPVSPERERELLVGWIERTLRAVVELAAPDDEGRPRAPIHLIFYERYDQRVLMDALGRHAGSVLAATPLYDFMTQMAAYDSPVATFLAEEIRELRNYPMVSQSLQAVAKWLRFDWRQGTDYWSLFKERMFDYWGKLDDPEPAAAPSAWYTNRARFSSQIPLEYAYAAWGEIEPPAPGERDLYAPYRGITPDLLIGFQQRRLEAMEWVAKDFKGNKDTAKGSFDLPDLAAFEDNARGLADALQEFLTIERLVSLNQWKQIRLQPPERRMLSGDTLVGRYLDSDQAPAVAAQNRENELLRQRREKLRAAWRAEYPDAKQVRLPKDQRQESNWSQAGLRVWLRLDLTGVDTDLDQVLSLTKLRDGDTVVLNPRWSVDGRLPPAEQVKLQTTSRQMLYRSQQARIVGTRVERDTSDRAVAGFVQIELMDERPGGQDGFVFRRAPQPLADGASYTLDDDPNDWSGSHQRGLIAALQAGGRHTLFDRLRGAPDLPEGATWPPAATAGQQRFASGLAALHTAGALHDFSPQVDRYIGEHGAAPVLLIQGPPGTGKSYSTAFALFARLQGAMAAGLDRRIFVCCNTHSATDVLLENIARVRAMLADFQVQCPALFVEYFDARLLDVPLFRVQPKGEMPDGIIALQEKTAKPAGQRQIADEILEPRWGVAAATPGGIRRAIVDRWGTKELLGHAFIDCLVLDEASRLSLPEAMMAALPLKPDGQLIVVGDHRQMPPIVQHDWANERRRSFRDYQTYESLFDTLRDRGLPGQPVYPMIQLDESFRLHAEMAEFLRREVYSRDGIAFYSRRDEVLPRFAGVSDFVAAVLAPEHPLIVVVHDERRSQQRNHFEQRLITPVLRTLADHGFDPEAGLGVVVPHRAQRAGLQEAVPQLSRRDPVSGVITVSAVDTVERYQGGEREIMIVSATESDPGYVLARSTFLLDPRRLTVALSRAKRKLVLVAARSIFELFSPDEEVFANAQLWKNLLHHTCTDLLWRGEVDGERVEVWGNGPAAGVAHPLPPKHGGDTTDFPVVGG
ncbi:MAG: PD-(D/E)XK nuclease family protein [Chloroflexia bacterium]|nr:PD-(D/E)XK nuclease family protein [Chloroflexia bacterium]